MKMHAVKSSNIKAIGYNNNTMRVEFKNGDSYEYFGVTPYQHKELMAAQSIGSHLFKMGIKGKKIEKDKK
jgi:KTSC domain